MIALSYSCFTVTIPQSRQTDLGGPGEAVGAFLGDPCTMGIAYRGFKNHTELPPWVGNLGSFVWKDNLIQGCLPGCSRDTATSFPGTDLRLSGVFDVSVGDNLVSLIESAVTTDTKP